MAPGSSVWVGAWWLGFVIAGTLLCIAAIPLLAFPSELPGDFTYSSGFSFFKKRTDCWPCVSLLIFSATFTPGAKALAAAKEAEESKNTSSSKTDPSDDDYSIKNNPNSKVQGDY